MPNTTYAGYNALLSGMSVLYKNHRFVADNIWKPLLVRASTGNYVKFDRTQYNLTETVRGVRQSAVSIDQGWVNDVYALDRHAVSQIVYDDEKDDIMESDAGQVINPDLMATQNIKEKLLLELEYNAFGANSPINSTSSTNNSGSTSLDLTTPTTDDWKTPLETACSTIEIAAGVTPNVLVTTPDVMRALMLTTQFQSSVQYVLPTVEIGGTMLPQNLLGLPVHYVQAVANTANDGLSSAGGNARIMPTNMWIGYIADNPMQKYVLTYGARFWNKDIVSSERSIDPRGTKYVTEFNYSLQVIAPECGYLITCTIPSGI